MAHAAASAHIMQEHDAEEMNDRTCECCDTSNSMHQWSQEARDQDAADAAHERWLAAPCDTGCNGTNDVCYCWCDTCTRPLNLCKC
jgi:hypothetical protein